MNTDVNITIIGAGVVGLAIAEYLSYRYDNIFVLEKNISFGQETSSRNSEVIHSGLYYPKDSLKAKLSLRGNKLIYNLCAKEDIPFNKCGKLIVATDKIEEKELDLLFVNAKGNGIDDLRFLNRDEIIALEPNISGIKALYSPSTGIIDSHGFMKYFEIKSKANGVEFAYLSKVNSIEKINEYYEISINDSNNQNFTFTTSIIINSAGLEAENISKLVGIEDESYKTYFCKGEYFSIKPPKNKLVSRLVYPVPNKNLTGLGIHSTIDLGGGLKLGPNVIYLEKNEYDYSVDEKHKEDFFQSAKKYLPFLSFDDLQIEMAGIRPKIQAPGSKTRDFIIRNEAKKGYTNFINLIGIESPGLTAAMAIAEYMEGIIIDI